MTEPKSTDTPAFHCSLSLHAGRGYLDESRLRLLQEVQRNGTLSAAADRLGISYKTAWSWLDSMGNAASGPLVESVQGGAHGGTSRLTELGETLLQQYEALCRRHRSFMESLGNEGEKPLDNVESFLRRMSIHTSARNQLHGTVERIWGDNIQAWVDVRIGSIALVTARVARSSIQDLGLDTGSTITTLTKATCVGITPVDFKPAIRKGPFNRIIGNLVRSIVDEDYAEIALDIGDGNTLTGLIPVKQWNDLIAKNGDKLCAWFDPDHVILVQLN